MLKQRKLASRWPILAALLLLTANSVHADNAKLDILGIAIGDTAEEAIAKLARATTNQPSITNEPCVDAQHAKRHRCVARIDARIDEIT